MQEYLMGVLVVWSWNARFKIHDYGMSPVQAQAQAMAEKFSVAAPSWQQTAPLNKI